MKISELIDRLEKFSVECGDAEEIQATHYIKPASEPKWIVFIDV